MFIDPPSPIYEAEDGSTMTLKTDFLATGDSDTLVRGDDWDFEFTIQNELGVPYDITNWTIWFTQKDSPTTADADAAIHHMQAITPVESDPTNGLAIFQVPASKTIDALTSVAHYDIQVVDTSVTPNRVKTIKYGRTRVVADRTLSIA